MFEHRILTHYTLAPLRTSDRKKLRTTIIESFNLTNEQGDLVVPEGLRSLKFSTHLDEPGVAYLTPEGDPLWLTIGIGSKTLIPTVYTLWRLPYLLPTIATPGVVIPKLTGGADLMVPGVTSIPSSTSHKDDLVSISQWKSNTPPLAVGRMALSTDELVAGLKSNIKGKAVHLVHAYQDYIWEMGSKSEPPILAASVNGADVGVGSEGEPGECSDGGVVPPEQLQPDSGSIVSDAPPSILGDLRPKDVDTTLLTAVIQSIYESLSKFPPSSLRIPISTFYTAYILPSRPNVMSFPSSAPQLYNHATATIKQSTFKNLSSFMKSVEKQGLLKLKEYNGGELSVVSVSSNHSGVLNHRPYETIAKAEAKAARKQAGREAELAVHKKEIVVQEFWKPNGKAIAFFEACGKPISAFYSSTELRTILSDYVVSYSLVNSKEPRYVDLKTGPSPADFPAFGSLPRKMAKIDAAELLQTVVLKKGEEDMKLMKRDEAFNRLINPDISGIQPWYQIDSGKESVPKKGSLKPISITAKIRNGNRTVTMITNFEPFGLSVDLLHDELRKICASATSVHSGIGGKASTGQEFQVQGKQLKVITEWLLDRGIPKKWIVGVDLTKK